MVGVFILVSLFLLKVNVLFLVAESLFEQNNQNMLELPHHYYKNVAISRAEHSSFYNGTINNTQQFKSRIKEKSHLIEMTKGILRR